MVHTNYIYDFHKIVLIRIELRLRHKPKNHVSIRLYHCQCLANWRDDVSSCRSASAAWWFLPVRVRHLTPHCSRNAACVRSPVLSRLISSCSVPSHVVPCHAGCPAAHPSRVCEEGDHRVVRRDRGERRVSYQWNTGCHTHGISFQQWTRHGPITVNPLSLFISFPFYTNLEGQSTSQEKIYTNISYTKM